MKSIEAYTPQERQASQLWAHFSRKNQQDFWLHYELLLQETQTLKPSIQKKVAIRTPQVVAQQSSPIILANTITFHMAWYSYLGHGLSILYLLAIAIASIIISVGSSSFPFICISLAIFGMVFNFSTHFYYFKVNQRGIGVYNPWRQKTALRWNQLTSVHIHQERKLKELVLTTQDGRLLYYDYDLSKKKHKRFFKIIRQFVNDVDDSNY
ncbi:hypothetical protein BKI52_00945 [marine bacterium AO1-C]|nr:hypothetical protein BKI52_00945 [marine bacterium AO1-C]